MIISYLELNSINVYKLIQKFKFKLILLRKLFIPHKSNYESVKEGECDQRQTEEDTDGLYKKLYLCIKHLNTGMIALTAQFTLLGKGVKDEVLSINIINI